MGTATGPGVAGLGGDNRGAGVRGSEARTAALGGGHTSRRVCSDPREAQQRVTVTQTDSVTVTRP